MWYDTIIKYFSIINVCDTLRRCLIWWYYPFVLYQPVGPDLPPSLFEPPEGSVEIVLIIAPAACGKSTLSRRFDSALYSRVNQDTLHTMEKCISYATDQLSKGLIFTSVLCWEKSYCIRWLSGSYQLCCSVVPSLLFSSIPPFTFALLIPPIPSSLYTSLLIASL